MSAEPTLFEPSRYLTQISGRDYLEVKWRLLWLRTLHPDALIETELVRDDGATALFKARVTLPSGGVSTGWGSETYQDFHDYVEKAETKSSRPGAGRPRLRHPVLPGLRLRRRGARTRGRLAG